MHVPPSFTSLRRAVLSAVLTIAMTVGLVAGLSGTANAATCGTVVEKIIGSQSLVQVAARFAGGGFYHFRTTTVRNNPAVLTWVNGTFAATYTTFPVNFSNGTVFVYLKRELVVETFNGRVQQVSKARPYVRACSNFWSVV